MSFEQLSSYQIGKMLHVSRQAVNQWIDKGYIASYRTPGGHRRVRREDLIGFLSTRSIPVPEALQRAMAADENRAQMRIMLLDDDEDFLALLSQALEERIPNVRVESYSNGFDALVAIGGDLPDLLLLDIKMPKIDGLEICRRLKQNETTRSLPIFVLTAHDSDEWRESLKALKVQQFFSKDEPLLEICDRIRLFAERRATALI